MHLLLDLTNSSTLSEFAAMAIVNLPITPIVNI